MKDWPARVRVLLPAVWLGAMLCVALIATPAGFALLPRDLAGAMAGRILGQEARLSLAFGAALLLLERWRIRSLGDAVAASPFSPVTLLAAGAVFCTVLGYFALQTPMAQARAGQSALSFGQWHAVSLAFYGLKLVLVAALAWRGAAPASAVVIRPPSS